MIIISFYSIVFAILCCAIHYYGIVFYFYSMPKCPTLPCPITTELSLLLFQWLHLIMELWAAASFLVCWIYTKPSSPLPCFCANISMQMAINSHCALKHPEHTTKQPMAFGRLSWVSNPVSGYRRGESHTHTEPLIGCSWGTGPIKKSHSLACKCTRGNYGASKTSLASKMGRHKLNY